MNQPADQLEPQIAQWRAYVAREPAVGQQDLDELEDHLRDQIADLSTAGLNADEAFLIAVKRLGDRDTLSREFAREHSSRLWKHLFLTDDTSATRPTNGLLAALGFAVAAGAVVQVARLASGFPDDASIWLARNLGLLVLPLLAGYFAHRRGLPLRTWLITALPFLIAAAVINLFPYREGSATEILVALHLPVLLWFAVAVPYMRGTWRMHERRMDFVRFTGEWLIYYALIALGGAVLMGLTIAILEPIGADLAEQVITWVLPTGAAGAVIIAAWLVEAKQQVVENMAPVLTAIFTPLFAVMLAGAAVIYALTGLGGTFDRELLGIFDALLIVVLGLVLYGMSAREPTRPPGLMDRIQLVAIVSALALNMMVLATMLARVGELGFTPNRTAALGLNIVLLVNLAVAAWLTVRFLTGKTPYVRLERWQTAYLPVFAVWTAAVVVLLPWLFAFA